MIFELTLVNFIAISLVGNLIYNLLLMISKILIDKFYFNDHPTFNKVTNFFKRRSKPKQSKEEPKATPNDLNSFIQNFAFNMNSQDSSERSKVDSSERPKVEPIDLNSIFGNFMAKTVEKSSDDKLLDQVADLD